MTNTLPSERAEHGSSVLGSPATHGLHAAAITRRLGTDISEQASF